MMTDPIADMLTRIRNANRVERPVVDMPGTKQKVAIAQVLKDEGFIHDYHVGIVERDEAGHPTFRPESDLGKPHVILRISLKYGIQGDRVIRHIARSSRPGRRYYRGYRDIRPVLNGLGIAVVSTSKGVMSDRRARAQKLGGEILCNVW